MNIIRTRPKNLLKNKEFIGTYFAISIGVSDLKRDFTFPNL